MADSPMTDVRTSDAAIIESAVLPVRPGMEAEFEAAFAVAEPPPAPLL